ncbi:MAG: VOC family protein [Cyanobacteria bacterium HKST-UBA05]|nr:VOC family protein [Cyanobacteria bacterium HKST-UBA05]
MPITPPPALTMIVLYVDAVQDSLPFYREGLGMHLVEQDAPGQACTYALLESPADPKNPHAKQRMALASRQWMAPWSVAPDPLCVGKTSVQLGFRVTDLEAAWAKACAYGAQTLAAPAIQPWGHRTVVLRAPDGTLLELAQAGATAPPIG